METPKKVLVVGDGKVSIGNITNPAQLNDVTEKDFWLTA